jgi:agmatinase
MKHSF